MTSKMDFLKLTNDKLSVEDVTKLVGAENCGAISLFIGTTRDNFEGKTVLNLEYEAYEDMAVNIMKKICYEIREKWSEVENIAIYHRLGAVPVKESSIIIAISSAHRSEAIEATRYCIDTVKKTVPIWKKEVYKEAKAEWKENKESSTYPPRIKFFKSSLESLVKIPNYNAALVQIKASDEEVQRRVDSFFCRKRTEINQSNVRDFCGRIMGSEDEFSCARIDTNLRRTKDSKSHLGVNRAYNIYWRDQTNFEYMKKHIPENGIEERLKNVENQLSLKTPVPLTVYRRLKEIEDRLLFLESLSPEYVKFWQKPVISENKPSNKRVYSVDDIDYLITHLEKKKIKSE